MEALELGVVATLAIAGATLGGKFWLGLGAMGGFIGGLIGDDWSPVWEELIVPGWLKAGELLALWV